jgi:hypothetical protein
MCYDTNVNSATELDLRLKSHDIRKLLLLKYTCPQACIIEVHVLASISQIRWCGRAGV